MSEEQINPVGDFIDQIAAGNYNTSADLFNELIQAKMQTALDAEKLNVAQTIYNSIDDEDDEDFEDEDLLDIDDEEEGDEEFEDDHEEDDD